MRLTEELESPTDMRIFMIGEALSRGISPEKIHELTNIDLWFLYKLEHIVELKKTLNSLGGLDKDIVKKRSFVDFQIFKFHATQSSLLRKLETFVGNMKLHL